MRKKVVAMVLVGGRGTRLGNITKETAKPAVSFGGKYRLIDFVLSNLTNSNITTCGIVTQYEPLELMSYIGYGSTWDLDVQDGGISFLTPYTTTEGEMWQKGTAHAILQHFKFIEQYNPDHVVILSGDHIYKMDYTDMINEHIKNNADITISAFSVYKDASRFGILQTDTEGKIISFEEKPEKPKSNKASMGVYVFNKNVLKELLDDSEGYLDFGKNVIPNALKQGKRLYCYCYNGYFKDVGTIDSLFKTNMDLIDNPQYLKLHEYKDSPIYTKSYNLPPHHVAAGGNIVQSLISDGCLIYGVVNHSILSSGVVVSEMSTVKNSILHENVRVEGGARIENCIICQNTVVPENCVLVFDEVTIIDNEFIEGRGCQYE